MTKTDARILVKTITDKVRAEYDRTADGIHMIKFPGPSVEVTNDVHPTPIENKVEVKGAQVTVQTKELSEIVAKALDAVAAQNSAVLAEVRALVAAVLKMADREPPPAPVVHVAAPIIHVPPHPAPPARPKSVRLETGSDGVRRAVPEY